MSPMPEQSLLSPIWEQLSFGTKGNGITYANMMAIKNDLKTAGEGVDFYNQS